MLKRTCGRSSVDQVRPDFADDLAIIVPVSAQELVEDLLVLARPRAELADIGFGIAVRLDRGQHLELVHEFFALREGPGFGREGERELLGHLDHQWIDQQRSRFEGVLIGELRGAIVFDLLDIFQLERIGPLYGQARQFGQRTVGSEFDRLAFERVGPVDRGRFFRRNSIGRPVIGVIQCLVRDQRFEFGGCVAILRKCHPRLAGQHQCNGGQTGAARGPSDRQREPCRPSQRRRTRHRSARHRG